MEGKKIFFSYARVDAEVAMKIANELLQAGANIWIDQSHIQVGNAWDIEIEKALENSDCLIVLLSPASVASSKVLNEVYYAMDENKSVFPVIIENCRIPIQMRRLQHIDLTSKYEAGFKKLSTALNLSTASVKEDEKLFIKPQQDSKTTETNLGDVNASLYFNHGVKKYEEKDYNGAIEVFSKVIKITPNNSNAYTYRGVAKYALNDYNGAIQDYNKAIEINPAYAITY
ncbi:MAG: TIR domain-containing protein [Ferruginibacter sp.]